MEEKQYISLIVLSLIIVIVRFCILKWYPNFLINSYIWMFVIPMSILYYYTKNFDYSLLVSLIIIITRTIYRYNTSEDSLKKKNYNSFKNCFLYFSSMVLIIFAVYFESELIKLPVKFLNFIILFYIFASIYEYIIHKYVMHCDNKSIFRNLKYIPFINSQYNNARKKHRYHHFDVNPNMSVKKNSIRESMYMGWDMFIVGLFFAFDSLLAAKYISGYEIDYTYIIIISLIFVFIWCYLWNKTHAEMHQFDNSDYSLKDGPHDNNYLNMSWITYLLFNNHKMHHLQKGRKKGNYNIIILGADEWFMDNRKVVNNKIYCKTHSEEDICKNELT